MTLTLKRRKVEADATLGELFVDGIYQSLTLEDLVRSEKVPGQTAIPSGKYEVTLTTSERARKGTLWSPRTDCALPLVLKVPGFEGIRIHAGNGAKDTEGCILVGNVKGEVPGRIFGSRAALTSLVEKLQTAPGRIWLLIEDVP